MAMPKQKPGKSKQDYETPKDLLDAIKARLRITEFEFDFACSKANKKARRGWTERDDSLSKYSLQWVMACEGGWGWLNPPFGKIAPWAQACRRAMRRGAKIAFLVPASVGSNWYRDHIHQQPGVTVLFLNGRPCFDPTRPKWGFPKDCMLVLFDMTHRTFSIDVWTWKESE